MMVFATSRTARLASIVSLAAMAVWMTASAQAQLPHVRLDSVFPPGGKIGGQVEVQLGGSDLDGVDRLIFSHPGISAEPKIQTLSETLSECRPRSDVFVVSISDDVPGGQFEVRAAGDFGISNPRWFHVDRLDNVTEPNDNSAADKAFPIAVGATVSARADADRIDYFRLALQEGQQVTIDCLAGRIDSRLSAALILSDSTGRELLRRRSTSGKDPTLTLTTPATGDFTLAVHDFLYRGGSEYFYRLSVHTSPHVSHIFPPCVEPGVPSTLTVLGYNLPGGQPIDAAHAGSAPLEQVDVELRMTDPSLLLRQNEAGASIPPKASMLDGWLYQLQSPTGSSNPVLLGAAQADVMIEEEPNDTPQEATAVQTPCEFVGRFDSPGDRDWAKFNARPGQVLRIEAISDRLGSPTDPVLQIERVTVNPQGLEDVSGVANVDDTDPAANNDPARLFQPLSGDPTYRLVADQEATYRVQIRDLYGAPIGGAGAAYRLVIREEQPDYRLVVFPTPADRRDRNKVFPSSPVLRRGGTVAYEVRCFRLDGFDGDVELTVEGLPDGVSCAGATLGGRADTAGLVLVADENAAAWSGAIDVVGRSTIGGREIRRSARTAAIVIRSDSVRDSPWVTRLTQQMGLSVLESETATARVDAGDGELVETSRGGRVELPLRIVPRSEFSAAGNPVVEGLPREIQVKTSPIAKDGGKIELNVANMNTPTGVFTFYARVPVKQKRLRNAKAIAVAEAEATRFEQLVNETSEQAASVTEAEKPQADRRVQEAKRLKDEADERVKEIREANKEREYTFELISTPVRLRIHDTPVRLSAEGGEIFLKKGGKVAAALSVERRFGFDDKVDVALGTSPSVPGLTAPQVVIAKGESTGSLELTANDQAHPGRYNIPLVGRLRFNNLNLEAKSVLTVRIEE